jgi:hypothetical protein
MGLQWVDTDSNFLRLSGCPSCTLESSRPVLGGFVLSHANEPRWAAILVFHEEGTASVLERGCRTSPTLKPEMEIQQSTQSIRSAVIAQGEAEACFLCGTV